MIIKSFLLSWNFALFYFTGLWMLHWPLSEYRLAVNGIYESCSYFNIFSDFAIFFKDFSVLLLFHNIFLKSLKKR